MKPRTAVKLRVERAGGDSEVATECQSLAGNERQDIVNYLAAFPKQGDLIRDTAGVRKLRWQRGGRGKSAGVRLIY